MATSLTFMGRPTYEDENGLVSPVISVEAGTVSKVCGGIEPLPPGGAAQDTTILPIGNMVVQGFTIENRCAQTVGVKINEQEGIPLSPGGIWIYLNEVPIVAPIDPVTQISITQSAITGMGDAAGIVWRAWGESFDTPEDP